MCPARFRFRSGWTALLAPLLLSACRRLPTEPLAVFDLTAHTGAVTALAVHPDGSLLVTGAADGTVRLWDLSNGGLLVRTILLGPSGEDVALNALAFSSDGRYLVVGGRLGGLDPGPNLRVYDAGTGDLVRTFARVPDVVLALAFTRDDALVAACLAGGRGLRLWNRRTGRETFRDDAYGGACTSLEVASDGAVLTLADGGVLRRYVPDSGKYRIERLTVPGHGAGGYARVDPDDQRLAVGWPGDPSVEFVGIGGDQGLILQDAYRFASDLGGGHLDWDRSGEQILSVTQAPDPPSWSVSRLDIAHNVVTWSASTDQRPTAMATLPDGRVVVGSADGSWFAIDPDERLERLYQAGGVPPETVTVAVAGAGGTGDGSLSQPVSSPIPPPDGLLPVPTLSILAPASDTAFSEQALTIRVLVDPHEQAMREFAVWVNDQHTPFVDVTERRGALVQPAGEEHLLQIKLPLENCVVRVQARNDGGWSPSIAVPLRWAPVATMPRSDLYVLSVGVSDYAADRYDGLRQPAADAQRVADLLASQEGIAYRSVQERLLVDEDATRYAIMGGLRWLFQSATSIDVTVVFLAGHGLKDPTTGLYLFLTHDVDPENEWGTALTDADLVNGIRAIPGKRVVFLDTCHAGALLSDVRLREAANPSAFAEQLARVENGAVVCAAAASNQAARESSTWGYGAFTGALLEGLSGSAASASGTVGYKDLETWLVHRVREMTGGGQAPFCTSHIPDFPLVVVPPARP